MLDDDAVLKTVDVGHHGLGAVVEGDVDVHRHQIAVFQRQLDVVLGLQLEKDVGDEIDEALTALLYVGVVLDIVLTDELRHGGHVVGVPEITVEIQYDFLIGHGKTLLNK